MVIALFHNGKGNEGKDQFWIVNERVCKVGYIVAKSVINSLSIGNGSRKNIRICSYATTRENEREWINFIYEATSRAFKYTIGQLCIRSVWGRIKIEIANRFKHGIFHMVLL